MLQLPIGVTRISASRSFFYARNTNQNYWCWKRKRNEGRWQGKEIVEIKVYRGGPSAKIDIYLYRSFSFQMFVLRKDLLSRIYRIYTPSVERPKIKISTGDTLFDNNYHIWADNEVSVKSFLTPERREIIQRLLSRKTGFQFLEITRNHLVLTKCFQTGGLGKHLSPIQIAEVLADMGRFIEIEDSW